MSDESPARRVWITKYALSTGIYTKIVQDRGNDLVRDLADFTSYYIKPDWHDSLSDAVKRAQVMRARRITALKKQLKKIESLVFDKIIEK